MDARDLTRKQAAHLSGSYVPRRRPPLELARAILREIETSRERGVSAEAAIAAIIAIDRVRGK